MIDVVVVNWNSGVYLKKCIDSIESHGSEVVEKIIIVDNGSADESLNDIKCSIGVKVILAGVNLGFGKACNFGALNSKSRYILFLNPDASLYTDTLKKALSFMDNSGNSSVGICGVQLVDGLGLVARSCARFPKPLGFLLQAFGVNQFIPRFGHLMAEWAHDETQMVDQVIGAFFLVRREVFEELGGFDERFFVYFEEVDFSLRAYKAGWRSVYLADTQAFHAGGGTSEQVKAKRLFYSLRSRLLYAFKHFNRLGAIAVLLSTLLIEPLARTALAIARLSGAALLETWEGYGMLWRWLPQWIVKGETR